MFLRKGFRYVYCAGKGKAVMRTTCVIDEKSNRLKKNSRNLERFYELKAIGIIVDNSRLDGFAILQKERLRILALRSKNVILGSPRNGQDDRDAFGLRNTGEIKTRGVLIFIFLSSRRTRTVRV
jgi:hypothetical protein